jgi:hypothetical protein
MDLFFQDPSEIPLSPEEVRFLALRGEPYPDGKRVRVYVELKPFQKRPSLELTIFNADGRQVAQARVIESMIRKLEMTLHLRESQPGGVYTIQALLYYEAPLEAEEVPAAKQLPPPLNVDCCQASFILPEVGSNPVTGTS